MTPAADHAARRDAVRGSLADAGIDALLVSAPANVRYLAGFTGSNGKLLLAAEAPGDRLLTDERYRGRAARECPGLAVEVGRDPLDRLADALADQRLGFEAEMLSVAAAERLRTRSGGLTIVGTSGLVEAFRLVKDDAEIARLAEACRLTTEAMAWLFEQMRPGLDERALAIALERRFVDLGADAPSFPSIVASGPNGAIPHHEPSERVLSVGDLVTVDAGAMLDGYRADCTRTVALGRVEGVLVGVHEVVRRAQAAGCAAAVRDVVAGDVDRAARQVVEHAGYGSAFVHGTGHGVGLEIHEAPAIGPGSRATLPAGAVLTVEPGIYLPDVGGVRIEDTLVVAPDGPPRPLTDIPRDLLVL
jgi:Xaa-Pro aminopeptidase